MGRKAKKEERIDIALSTVKFRVARDRSRAVAVVDYDKILKYGDTKPIEVRFPVISCWMDRHNNSIIKAYLRVEEEGLQAPEQKALLRAVMSNGSIDGRDGYLTGELWGRSQPGTRGMLRLGAEPETVYRKIDEDYKTYHVFDSKALALNAILNKVKLTINVGGVDLIDFSLVPDSVLVEAGFEKVAPLVGRGPDMWMGNVDSVVNAGSTWASTENQQRNCTSFLNILAASIQATKKAA